MHKDGYKKIPNYPDYYISDDGKIWSNKTRRFLKLNLKRNNRLVVCLCKNRLKHFCSVHRLVLEAFIGQCPKGMETRHLNGNPQDNKLENLCWGTHSDNAKDAIRHGTHVDNRGEKCGNAKLTQNDVKFIRYVYGLECLSNRKIAKYMNVSHGTVNAIVNNYTWRV